MKKYFYITLVLALLALTIGIGSQIYLTNNLSDITITESTLAGDKEIAEGLNFSQMFYHYNFSDPFSGNDELSYYCWNINTDVSKPENSKVRTTKLNTEEDISFVDQNDKIGITPLFALGSTYTENDIGYDPEEILYDALNINGYFISYSPDLATIVTAVSDHVGNGEKKTETITLKDYTDVMPLIISYNDFSYGIQNDETENGEKEEPEVLCQAILKKLPQIPLSGDETIDITIKKDDEGYLTELEIDIPECDNNDKDYCKSVQTDKGLFFTYYGDSDQKTMSVYYVPTTGKKSDSGNSLVDQKDCCRKLITLDKGETVEALNWDDTSGRLLIASKKDEKICFASYDPNQKSDQQVVRFYEKDVTSKYKRNLEDSEAAVYSGYNIWVYAHRNHGLTAFTYNSKTAQYEVVMDLDSKTAFSQKYLNIYTYDPRTKVVYKDGKLAILYSTRDRDYYESDRYLETTEKDDIEYAPGETALCVYTEKGLGYYGIYHSSLYDNLFPSDNVMDDAIDEYQLNWE